MRLINLQRDLKSDTYQGFSDQKCHFGFSLCCFGLGMLRFYSKQSAWNFLQKNFYTNLNLGNILWITRVHMAYQIDDQYLPFIHSWNSGAWQVLCFPLLLVFCCFLCLFALLLFCFYVTWQQFEQLKVHSNFSFFILHLQTEI